MPNYIAAIDQGTTSTRCILFDHAGNIVAVDLKEHAQIYPRPGWVEHDALEIWAHTQGVIAGVLAKAGVTAKDIAAAGVTNQRETTLVWEKATGKPVHNAIVWQDTRTDGICHELAKDGGQDRLRPKTGLPLATYFSGPKIKWILDNVPGARERAEAGELLFGTMDTWIIWNLTGKHVTDVTNASRTLLMNLEMLDWDEEILELLDIPRVILPKICSSSEVYGEVFPTRWKDGLQGVPIAGDLGDQQAALFGQACFEPGTMKNTYGTGCFVLMNAGRKRPVSKHGLITTLGCGGRGEPVYVLEGAIFIAGAAIQWLRDGLKILKGASQSEALAGSVEDNAGVYFVPALVGLGAPYWDSHARGAIFGITRGTRASHIIRAALEAMCYQTKDVIDAMQKDSKLKIKSLKVDGGAVANNFLCQFQAGLLGIDVVRPKVIEITSLGAAYLAGLAIGYWKDADEIKKCWMVDKVFRPKMPKDIAKGLCKGWSDAVERTLTDRGR